MALYKGSIKVSGSGANPGAMPTVQPQNPSVGEMYYDTTAGILKVYTGSSGGWQEVGGGNVIAMTQSEYNALSSAEKNDGKLRIITDATQVEMASKDYVDDLVGDVETLLAAL